MCARLIIPVLLPARCVRVFDLLECLWSHRVRVINLIVRGYLILSCRIMRVRLLGCVRVCEGGDADVI